MIIIVVRTTVYNCNQGSIVYPPERHYIPERYTLLVLAVDTE